MPKNDDIVEFGEESSNSTDLKIITSKVSERDISNWQKLFCLYARLFI